MMPHWFTNSLRIKDIAYTLAEQEHVFVIDATPIAPGIPGRKCVRLPPDNVVTEYPPRILQRERDPPGQPDQRLRRQSGCALVALAAVATAGGCVVLAARLPAPLAIVRIGIA